jgi:hypothetical protein
MSEGLRKRFLGRKSGAARKLFRLSMLSINVMNFRYLMPKKRTWVICNSKLSYDVWYDVSEESAGWWV